MHKVMAWYADINDLIIKQKQVPGVVDLKSMQDKGYFLDKIDAAFYLINKLDPENIEAIEFVKDQCRGKLNPSLFK